VWCPRNSYTFVALKLAWGEARGRECIRSDKRYSTDRATKPQANFSATRRAVCRLGGGVVAHSLQIHFGICSSLAPRLERKILAANTSHLGDTTPTSAQNPLPRMYSYFGDTTLADGLRKIQWRNQQRYWASGEPLHLSPDRAGSRFGIAVRSDQRFRQR
jgi:hypothetical protein